MARNKKNPFRNTWKDYLSLSVRERNGMYALLLIFFIQIFTLYYLHFLSSSQEGKTGTWLTVEAAEWMELRSAIETKQLASKKNIYSKDIEIKGTKYFRFNPNTCSTNEFLLLGLSSKQAKMIEKFRTFGEGFKSKADFAKLYCLSEKEYKNLEPWIDLPDTFKYIQKLRDYSKSSGEKVLIDLSNADSATLLKVPGIGPSFAGRITKYGKRLGAYYSVEQLKEVWGISDTLYQKFKPYFYISDSLPGTIKLNEISISDFGKHPYVGYSIAKVIISYREQHGPFKSFEELKKVPILTDELYKRILPYLAI